MSKQKCLAVIAYNLRSGGGVTYLENLLRYAQANDVAFTKIYVFGGKAIKGIVKDFLGEKIVLVDHPTFNRNSFWRLIGQQFIIPRLCEKLKIDVLYSPGVFLSSLNNKIKMVAACLNVLPFQLRDIWNDGIKIAFRRLVQRFLLLKTYAKAHGVIFISKYGVNLVANKMGKNKLKQRVVIPLGVDVDCFGQIRQKDSAKAKVFLYVSALKSYKHHCKVVKAFAALDPTKNNFRLIIVGDGDLHIKRKIIKQIADLKLGGQVFMSGKVSFAKLKNYYEEADIFIFASTAESCPTILLEALAAGKAIVCSDREPMPEFAGPGAVYFNPEEEVSIYHALAKLAADEQLRKKMANQARQLGKNYSYQKMAEETFLFLNNIIQCQTI